MTSGSAAYHLNWQTGAIEHDDGRAWFVPRYMQRVYAALDAIRGEAATDERLAEALWGKENTVSPEAVRVAILNLRRMCGREIVETQPLYLPRQGGPMRCGYVVRPVAPGERLP